MAASEIIQRMQDAAAAYDKEELGARATLLDLNNSSLQNWRLQPTLYNASLGGSLEVASNTNIFQHLQKSENGLTTQALSEKTGIATTLLDRFMMTLGYIGEACARTGEVFRAMAAEAGLEVVGIFSNAASTQSVIELMLPSN
ncbi:hypothetical protein NW768_005321 [Fusarium equiseti]|uniref:Uncharacterized protein n=1 Tax=Fusarium equiseti TaxID=61235 RepID=A0ABQ8REZ9_FUSEQ|nr:hypothetical protein NW768_005321 [Fusarium equiseti]